MKRLIITGDDYGLCDSVNRAIEECLAAGAMRATCVMANMPAAGEAGLLRRRFPDSSVGIHWNLTQGRPVLPRSAIPTLVGSDGQFFTSLRHRWLRRKVRVEEICAELRAQYERFCALAGQPDFWNTHQNVHVFPGLFKIFVKSGRELGIRAMRSHRRFTVPFGSTTFRYHLSHPLYWTKGKAIAFWCRQAAASGTRMPDGRLYLPGYGPEDALLEAVLNRVRWRDVKDAVEWVVHPATEVNKTLFGMLTESRVREYEIFRDARVLERLRRSGLGAVGFEILSQRGSSIQETAAA